VVETTEPWIRTPDQRLRVFVSSTLNELAEERAAVRAALERLRLIPVMFELGARPHAPRNLYRAYLEQSHVFLGVYWQRYGWVAPEETISGLEDEYRRAGDLPQLIYVKEPAPEREPRLEALLETLRTDDRASYRPFTTPEELAELVQSDLVVLLTERFEAGGGGTRAAAPTALPRSNVPVPLTPTVGRAADIDAVVDQLTSGGSRLVTVTGPGGVGKSRLGLEVARRAAPTFPDGTFLVSLGPVPDADGVLGAIADQLGVIGEGRRSLRDVLADHLHERRLLLLLDNFEHVVAAAPELATLLDGAPGLHALVTSRQPLRLRGEHEHLLEPLAMAADPADPDHAGPAVQLFLQRARAVRPGLTPSPHELASIVELVRRLDGLPLAIELAAARARLFPPAVLLERLEQRTDALGSGARDLPERQRTMRATLDWSYRLLSPEEQRLFQRISVFSGAASLEAIEAVAGGGDRESDALEALASLVEKCLVTTAASEAGPHVRLLYLIRAYARELLEGHPEEVEPTRDRHAAWFLERALLVDPIRDPAAHHRHAAMLEEVDDVRGAMAWVLARGDVARTAAFARATWMWFWLHGRIPAVRPWFEAAAELADEPEVGARHRGGILYALSHLREVSGDSEGALAAAGRALEAFEEAGDDLGRAGAHLALAAALPHLGEVEASMAHAEAALSIGEGLGEAHLQGYSLAIIGTHQAILGQLDEARHTHERMRAAAQRIPFPDLEAQAVMQLALVAALAGDVTDAWSQLADAATILDRTDSREMRSYWLEFAATALAAAGEHEDAYRALLVAEQLRAELHIVIWPLLRTYQRQLVADVTAALGGRQAELTAEAPRIGAPDLLRTLLDRHGRVTRRGAGPIPAQGAVDSSSTPRWTPG
jgi:predicted ATPase